MITITRESITDTIEGLLQLTNRGIQSVYIDIAIAGMRHLLASLESEQRRNPVLAYADSYRDMAKQGVESVPVWSVITDLERNIAPLYTAPPAPLSVPDALANDIDTDDHPLLWSYNNGWNACRTAMLQGSQPVSNRDELPPGIKPAPELDSMIKNAGLPPGNSQVIPDGYVVVPKRLTAENGAKGVMIGEFSETKFINCPECFGDDECETCDGSGRIEISVPVSWTNIKAIWAKGVEHFAAAPKQETL